ncbi:helix-turn-helix domain-containing protein [Paenibacillus yanchengensis]|uniref:Helix-turn-helix domain-containing protein n=1 Tax=Paenibacillus yanchengensis TaxID=2035833 RepID=A0ABW4YFX4_9BACL
MTALLELDPSLRAAHYYRFPLARNDVESFRMGYCYAIHLVAGGSGSITVAEKVYPLKKGDLIFLPPLLEHAFYAKPDYLLETYNLYIDPWEKRFTPHHIIWDRADFDPSLLTDIRHKEEFSHIAYVTNIPYYSFLSQTIVQVVEKFDKQSPYDTAIVHHLLRTIIWEMVVLSTEHTAFADYRIASLLDQVEKQATNNKGYRAWLAQCDLQKTQLYSLFKQATGMSPKKYWQRALMKNIETALLESNRTVTMVAEDFGFSSVHHFTKQFTLFYGVSPTEFRTGRRSGKR